MWKSGKAKASLFAELTLDAVLLVLFIAQAFLFGCILIFGNVPLPAQWANQAINRQLPAGLSFWASNYSLALDGTVEIEDLRIHADGFRLPLFEADGAVAEMAGINPFNFKPELRELVLANGLLNLPAVHSPTGQDSPILKRIALRATPTEGGIRIDSLAALHDDLRLRGSLNWSFPTPGSEAKDTGSLVNNFLKQAAYFVKQKARIEGLHQPTLFFQIESNGGERLNIESVISTRDLKLSQLHARDLSLDVALELLDSSLVTKSSLLLRADTLELPSYQIKADSIQALIDREEWEAFLQGEWPYMEIAARRLEIERVELDSPQIKIMPQAYPDFQFEGTTSGLKGAVEFAGSFNAQQKNAEISAAGSVDLLSIAPETVTERLPPIEFGEPPYYNLHVKLGDGLKLESAQVRARIDEVKIKGVHFDHIRSKGSYSEGIFNAKDLYLRRDWQWLDLALLFDSGSKDFELSLIGHGKPYDYNDLLPRWWAPIFRDFSFEDMQDGFSNYVIYGNTTQRAADFYFGHTYATKVAYKGVMVDKGTLYLRGRGPYAEIHALDAETEEGGFARGDIEFSSRLDDIRAPMSLRLDLDTKLSLEASEKLFDKRTAGIIADFESDGLPEATIEGVIFNNKYPEFAGKTYIELTADSPAPIRYKGIQLDFLNFQLFGRNDVTHLRELELGFAGGDGRLSADILTPKGGKAEARFQFNLVGADQDRALHELKDLSDESEAPNEPSSPSDSEHKGAVALQLSARGPVEDPLQFMGYGTFGVENEGLSSIELFGPLSRRLKDTKWGFTSFTLTQMDADFQLNENIIDFSRLEINGPRTRIEAPGTLQLDDLALGMRVSVYLFANAGNPESNLRKIGEFLSKPFPNLLEFELSGTPENQKWRSLYDPRNLIPQL